MKIISAAIQNIDQEAAYFSEQVAHLASDMELPLELISTQPREVPYMPVVVGAGIPAPATEHMRTQYQRRDRAMRDMVRNIKDIYPHVGYDIDIGVLPEKVQVDEDEKNIFMWIVNRRSSPSFFSEVFGTQETLISHETTRPVLVVPSGTPYTTPGTVLTLLSADTVDDLHTDVIREIRDRLGFDTHYILHLNDQKLSIDMTRSELRGLLGDKYHDIKGTLSIVPDDNPIAFMEYITKEIEPDWIAVNRMARSLWERIYTKHSVNHMVLNHDIPVLVF